MREIYRFGAERIDRPRGTPRAEVIRRNRMMLARALNLHTTVAFAGAGCSVPLGYPVWRDFARDVDLQPRAPEPARGEPLPQTAAPTMS